MSALDPSAVYDITACIDNVMVQIHELKSIQGNCNESSNFLLISFSLSLSRYTLHPLASHHQSFSFLIKLFKLQNKQQLQLKCAHITVPIRSPK